MTTSTDTRVTLEILEGPDYSDEDGWEHHAYKVRLHRAGRQMTTTWMQGLGITDDPNPRDVLESLFLDAAGYDNARGFEDWANDYGYDSDSRKAEALYRRVGQNAKRLANLFDVSDNSLAPWMTEEAETLARRYADAS